MISTISKTLSLCLFASSLALVFSACGKKDTKPPAAQPAEVSVLTVASERVNRTTELPGRINPMREAQVRARATGILLKRLFVEGSNVKEGQVLFEIDPAPLQASLNSAKALMAKTEALLKESKANVDRYKELVQINAIFTGATISFAIPGRAPAQCRHPLSLARRRLEIVMCVRQ